MMTNKERKQVRDVLKRYLHNLYDEQASSIFEAEKEEEVQEVLKALSYL